VIFAGSDSLDPNNFEGSLRGLQAKGRYYSQKDFKAISFGIPKKNAVLAKASNRQKLSTRGLTSIREKVREWMRDIRVMSSRFYVNPSAKSSTLSVALRRRGCENPPNRIRCRKGAHGQNGNSREM